MNSVPVSPPVTEYLYRKATAAGTPLSGTFELTPVCNMHCKMCYVQSVPQAPLATAAQWLDLAKEARDAGMLYLLLTGGEPFMYPEFRALLEGLHKLGLLVTLNSNGTLIDENVIAWLKKRPPVRVNISLYGASDETYGKLCGNSKGYTQVTKAIDLLLSAGISVKLNCSLTPHNAADLPQMAKYAEEKGLYLQVATYMFPPVRRDASMVGQNDRFSPEAAAYYMAYADYLTMGEEKFLEKAAPSIPEDTCASPDGIRCRAGRCSFWVTWQGQLLPCGMFPSVGSCNVFENSFADGWTQVKESTAAIRLPEKCAGCSVKDSCRACGAMVVTESGCFDKVPQYRCDMMHAYPAQYSRVKEEILWARKNSKS